MACLGHCCGTSSVRYHVQLPVSQSGVIQLHPSRACRVPDSSAGCAQWLQGGKCVTCTGMLKPRTFVGFCRRNGFVMRAVGREATMVVQEVDFTWKGPATEVSLTGDFLKWETMLPLEKGSDGIFHIKQKLPPGNYLYKFVVDGQWMHSPDNPTVPDGAGSFNNQIVVPAVVSNPEAFMIAALGTQTETKNIGAPKFSDGNIGIEAAENEILKLKVATDAKIAAKKVVENIEGGKVAGAKVPRKAADKSLSALIAEDVIPMLKASLEKEDGVLNVDLSFENNQVPSFVLWLLA
eukprot:c24399_g1_i1 orf=124-1002(-)